jgi:hypothetical protein
MEDEGASRQSIKKYIIANYNVPEKSPYLKRATRQLINAQNGEPRLYTKGKKTGTYYASSELKAKNTRSYTEAEDEDDEYDYSSDDSY